MDNLDYMDDDDETPRPVGRPPGAKGKKRRLSGDEKPAQGESVQYHCDYCQRDISDVVRIRCAVCKDFDLCLHCFSVGVEIRGHKNDHAYRIMDYTSFPLFEEGWGADEELLLLEGIQMHGFGNWTEIADHVATKSVDACREHYLRYYINSPTCPLPDTSRILTNSLEEYHKKRQEKLQQAMLEPPPEGGDGAKGPGGKTVAKNLNKKTKIKSHNVSCPVASAEYAGYMPKRYEFENEWDNEAEYLIADLVFTDGDDEALIDLKLQIVDIYNRRLKERVERRKFVIDNNLMDFYHKKSKADKSGKNREQQAEEKALWKTMQKFMQAHNREQHEQFIEGLVAESALKKRIQQLQDWRKNGVTSIAEGEIYETEKKRKESMLKRTGSTTALLDQGPIRGVRWLNRKRGSAWALPVPEKESKTIRRQVPLDLTGAPGVDQLSTAEKELCSTLRLYPQQYTMIKEALVRESLSPTATLSKGHMKKLVKLETSKANKIYDFLEKQGWIQKK